MEPAELLAAAQRLDVAAISHFEDLVTGREWHRRWRIVLHRDGRHRILIDGQAVPLPEMTPAVHAWLWALLAAFAADRPSAGRDPSSLAS